MMQTEMPGLWRFNGVKKACGERRNASHSFLRIKFDDGSWWVCDYGKGKGGFEENSSAEGWIFDSAKGGDLYTATVP